MKMSDICNYKDIYACTMSFLYNVFSYLVRSACDLETKPHTHDDCSLFSHREIWEKTSVLSFSHFFLVSFSLVNRENPIFFYWHKAALVSECSLLQFARRKSNLFGWGLGATLLYHAGVRIKKKIQQSESLQISMYFFQILTTFYQYHYTDRVYDLSFVYTELFSLISLSLSIPLPRLAVVVPDNNYYC